uniref:RING-type E3 ubiquitin transferase n=1 Tax=Ananas comosus var. bracteatus TaxID=296719 RepID=A0A6V7PLR9_ANACO|nr:unnamed protein product [Ananas comosus var. bracteatus]
MEEIDDPTPAASAPGDSAAEAAASSVASSSVASSSAAPPPASATGRRLEEEEEDDDDDEGDVCRICRNPGDAENPLRYPCACSGSIKFVHQECLLQWLSHSNARQCEVCKHVFSFSPVYAEDAPARLPFQEFVVGTAMKACHVLQFFLRLAFVLSVWLLIIPFITFWIWRLTFVRTLGEAQRLFLSHISAPVILTDCLHGFLLSASIVFIFLGATSLRDYFRHLREVGGNDGERDDEVQERHGARAVRRLAGPANRIPAGDGNVEDGQGAQGIAGAGQMIRRNAENVAARLEMQAARLEAQVEQMFDGLDDADGAEDVPFDELVGMQGPVFHLVENAITVLASNAIFLGVVIFVPFSLGRIVLYYLSWFFSSASSSMLASVMPITESALSLANIGLKNALSAVKNFSSESHNEGFVGHVMEVAADTLKKNITELDVVSNSVKAVSTDVLKETTGSSRLSDVTTLAVGYTFIFSLVFLYLGIFALLRYVKGERLTIGRLYGLAAIVEAIPSLFRQFLAGMRHLLTMVKVAFLLVIELGVFPLMCGWWLDVCTLKMLGATIAQRVEFFLVAPLVSTSIHWLVGIVYMLQISIFVLRNGVLYFLRDPADPNYNPFRDLIDDPLHKHARRVLLSVAVYGSLIVMLVFLPVKVAMRLAPSIFPLDISVFDPFTEIPADMLLFQICIPFAIDHFKPRETIKSLLRYWFAVVGWALGLSDFLLPRPEENGGHENGNGVVRLDRIHERREGGIRQRFVPHVAVEDHDRRGNAIENADVADDSNLDDQADSEYGFALRIVLYDCHSHFPWACAFQCHPRLPIMHGIKCNDLLAFSIGCYVIWSVAAGARYSYDYIKTKRVWVLLSQISKWCAIVLKSFALLSIWIFVIPVLIGLLFELLIIIWTRLVMLDQMAPLVDESWRRKFERVREDGFSRLRGLWVLREIVIPIISKLLTALCVPYVFAKGIFPVFGYPLIVNSAVYRFAWLGCLVLSAVYFCGRRFHTWFTNLHNSIRDDRYLIGRRLHNFGEESVQQRTAGPERNPQPQETGLRDLGLIRLDQEVGDLGLRLRRANQRPNQQARQARY